MQDIIFRIVPNMPYEDYEKEPYINGSLLGNVESKSMRTVKAIIDGRVMIEGDVLDFGEAFHALLLEGKVVWTERPSHYPAPSHHAKVKSKEIKEGDALDWNANANHCKTWEASQNGIVLTAKEAEDIRNMVEAVGQEEELKGLLKGKTELSIFASNQNGKRLKARIDLLPDDPEGPVIDFKKTRCASPEKFMRQLWDLKYFIKAALYLDVLKMAGMPRKEFWFVAVEDAYPHDIFVCKLRDDHIGLIAHGRKVYREAYVKLMNAQQTGKWPSYGAADGDANLTTWMMMEIGV